MADRPTLMTRSSATLSLFAEPSVSAGRPSSFALSIMAHMAVVGFVYFAVTHLPRIVTPIPLKHYSVRQLDLRALDPDFPNMPQIAAEEESKIPYPSRDVVEQISVAEAMHEFIGSATGRQTLVQPEFETHLSFSEQVPMPTMMIWTPEMTPQKRLVAPLPNPPAASEVKPSFELPNQEIKLADVEVATTNLLLRSEPVPAGSTSPMETHSPKPVQMAPTTISPSLEQPTPIAVLSISDVRMLDGTMLLPPVNDLGPAGSGKLSVVTQAVGSANASNAAKLDDVDDVAVDGRRLSAEHIVVSRDGKFSVVVVGSSLEDEYPETAELWANRVAYTAYLHVGLKKSWILQYSVTRPAEMADAGRVARLEAPWPYDILRPNLLARDVNGDALMVHGVLNQAGRFESLAIAFPSGFRYASFVLRALRQWQFRPARQNGQATAVEVLLIIPEELD